ncbi:MAG TPA: hypothetical protein VGH22_20690 [Candidatus Binatia bacterium]
MKPLKLIVSTLLATALVPNGLTAAIAGGAGKQIVSQRGGKAADHMSEKASSNGNAQWSADPERGWIRAENRHDLHEQNHKSTETKRPSNKGKSKRKSD